jgi:hypothetical protein
MAQSKPNKQLKSPKKQLNKEQNKQNKTNTTQSVTPNMARETNKPTETETPNESTEKRDRPHKKGVCNPIDISCYEANIPKN